ncbi:hypothetical protein CPJCM30710_18560 [Clostridium polyendosporum]|uniref:DUF1292 domain-containing protein n=1 Tax=Clostridium polyendosporum TaxID=69208 RepID=A0A919VG97_9CLOT|nr:DUF1292 domain-containing protein [Clostridium polyendosporum]GIM29190.1 hypothetical protein CPJCM30710_18560 [Clostridium polyendosporum]
MSRDLEFIKQDKDRWGKVYIDISYAVDNVAPFLSEKTLKIRKYYSKKDVLKKYINLLESAESENTKSSFLKGLFGGNKYETLLTSYKRDYSEDFDQLEKCSKCACLNCIKECNFNTCLGCRRNSLIKKCDHEKINITYHDNFTLELTNNNNGRASKYKVLATLQDCELQRQYIIIENLFDNNDKFILYYYPGISEDSYGEITDSKEFDFVVETLESANL